jgi:hypothetical protein
MAYDAYCLRGMGPAVHGDDTNRIEGNTHTQRTRLNNARAMMFYYL